MNISVNNSTSCFGLFPEERFPEVKLLNQTVTRFLCFPIHLAKLLSESTSPITTMAAKEKDTTFTISFLELEIKYFCVYNFLQQDGISI